MNITHFLRMNWQQFSQGLQGWWTTASNETNSGIVQRLLLFETLQNMSKRRNDVCVCEMN